MSYKTPKVANLTLKGIDKKLQDISSHMSALTWLTYAFGLADRMVETRDNNDYIFPACYINNTKDPIDVMPSDNYKAFCFWTKDSEGTFDYDKGPARIYYEVSCIFYVNLERVDATANFKETKTKIRQDIMTFFNREVNKGIGVLRMNSIVDDDITEVYEGFSMEQLDNKFKMLPKYALRVDFELSFIQECSSSYNTYGVQAVSTTTIDSTLTTIDSTLITIDNE